MGGMGRAALATSTDFIFSTNAATPPYVGVR